MALLTTWTASSSPMIATDRRRAITTSSPRRFSGFGLLVRGFLFVPRPRDHQDLGLLHLALAVPVIAVAIAVPITIAIPAVPVAPAAVGRLGQNRAKHVCAGRFETIQGLDRSTGAGF